jgi:predicted esterase
LPDTTADGSIHDDSMPPSDGEPDRSRCTADPDVAGITHRMVTSPSGQTVRYVGFAPSGYTPANPLALVIVLHGAGDTMDNYFNLAWRPNAADKHFLVVAPEGSAPLGSGYTWTGDDANQIVGVVNDFAHCYSVDSQRRIIHGFSAGGVLAYYMALAAPQLFAGISISSADLGSAEAVAGHALVPGPGWSIPVSQTHGVYDPNFPIEYARAGRDRLIAAGHTVYWHEFDGGHTTNGALVGMTYDDLATSRAPL